MFLFDELLSNLDALLRVKMRVELANLHREIGATMVYATHNQVEVMTMADKIVLLDHGQVQQVGSPLALYDQPQNRFVAGFIGLSAMSFLPVTAGPVVGGEQQVRLSGQLLGAPIRHGRPLAEGSSGELGIRPEHCRLAEGDDAQLRGRVELVES